MTANAVDNDGDDNGGDDVDDDMFKALLGRYRPTCNRIVTLNKLLKRHHLSFCNALSPFYLPGKSYNQDASENV